MSLSRFSHLNSHHEKGKPSGQSFTAGYHMMSVTLRIMDHKSNFEKINFTIFSYMYHAPEVGKETSWAFMANQLGHITIWGCLVVGLKVLHGKGQIDMINVFDRKNINSERDGSMFILSLLIFPVSHVQM